MANSTTTEPELRELSDRELLLELVSQIPTFVEYEEFLEDARGSTFRLRHRDDLEYADLCAISTSNLLVQADVQTQGDAYWELSPRAELLLDRCPAEIDDETADAILTLGDRFLALPESERTWTVDDLDLDLYGRVLGSAHSADLIKIVEKRDRTGNRWSMTDRATLIRASLVSFVEDVLDDE